MLKTARRLRSDERVHDAAPDSALAATIVAMRSVAGDTAVFAGVDADQAAYAIRDDYADLDVPAPPPAPRTPFKDLWQARERTEK